MWFKNIYTFKLDTEKVDFDNLENNLLSKPLVWPQPTQLESFGWVNVIGETICHAVNGAILIKLGHHKRNLPAKVVNAELKDRIAAIEEAQDRKVGSIERKNLRDDVVFELLPKAFVETTYTDAWIDADAGALYIDSGSASKAEQFTKVLRSTLGTLPVTLPEYEVELPVFLTNAVREGIFGTSQNDTNEGRGTFSIQYNCKLEGYDKESVTYKNISLDSDSVVENLDEGRYVTELGVSWGDRISFTLNWAGVLKSLSFGEEVTLMMSDVESKAQQIDAEFAIMSGEIRQLISDLESDKVLGLAT